MEDIEILKDKLKIKEKELEDYVLDINNNCLSEEAEQIRAEIYDLQNEISKREKNYNSVTEDLKILEELVDIYYDCAGNKEQDYDMRVDMSFMKKEAHALENLIKGYRELKEKLDNSRKANELLHKTNNELRWEIRTTYSKAVNDIISKFDLGDDYIQKSKIAEIRDKAEVMDYYVLSDVIEDLNKLLGEK